MGATLRMNALSTYLFMGATHELLSSRI